MPVDRGKVVRHALALRGESFLLGADTSGARLRIKQKRLDRGQDGGFEPLLFETKADRTVARGPELSACTRAAVIAAVDVALVAGIPAPPATFIVSGDAFVWRILSSRLPLC